MNPFTTTTHQLIYQQPPHTSNNGSVSPSHSPTRSPSPTISTGQTPPNPGYSLNHGVQQVYNNSQLFSFQPKLPPKIQQPLNHVFGPPPPLYNQHTVQPGQSLSSQSTLAFMPQMNIPLSTSVLNPLSITSAHWQQQLNYAQLSRRSSSPHHHARKAAVAARNNNNIGSSAIAITDPNNPNKPPINGFLTKRDINGGVRLKNISRELFQYNFLTTLYIGYNDLTHISPEIGKLKNLILLDISGNKLAILPPELGMLTSLKNLLLFDNMIVTLPFELGTLYQLEILGLEGNPINDTIKNLLQKEGTSSVISFLRDNCQVPPRPMKREWIRIESENTGRDRGDIFTLICYNILARKYATTQTYGYTPSWALDWDYRKELIIQEVMTYDSDIICFQEVDTSQYEEYFRDSFFKLGGYDSVYWPKSRAKTMSDSERKSVDGCATFFKASKFQLIDKQLIEFNQVALQRADKKTEDMINRVITKDNIAIVTLLENKETHDLIIVGNCHIHWDPLFADVKLVQVAMLMDELDKLCQKWFNMYNSNSNWPSPHKISTIICGDFNSTPDSGVYEFLSRGSIGQDHTDFGNHIYGSLTSDGLSHKYPLKSAYSNIEELPFTNFTPTFTGVIDYIWYSTNTLNVTKLLGGVDEEYISKIVGFPNAHFPSDHIIISTEFRVKPPQTVQPAPQFNVGVIKRK
nr:7323_t:CDS:2 [Entrophospora candida]